MLLTVEQLAEIPRPHVKGVRLLINEGSVIVNNKFGLRAVPDDYEDGRSLLIAVARLTTVLTPRTIKRGVFKGDSGKVDPERISVLSIRFSTVPLRRVAYIGDEYEVRYLGSSNEEDGLFSIGSTNPVSPVYLSKTVNMRRFLEDMRLKVLEGNFYKNEMDGLPKNYDAKSS